MPTSQWGREHPNETDQPEDHEVVAPADAHKHGYWGRAVDPTPKSEYTFPGTTVESDEESGGSSRSESKQRQSQPTTRTPRHEQNRESK